MSRAVEFCTRSYVLSHGKQPRGRGYWAFALVQRVSGGRRFRMPPIFAPGPASLAEAKAWAAAQAMSDTAVIEVLP